MLGKVAVGVVGSDATLPLPSICIAALQQHQVRQQEAQVNAGRSWQGSNLIFTTRYGTPIEPRNFSRSYDLRIFCSQGGGAEWKQIESTMDSRAFAEYAG